ADLVVLAVGIVVPPLAVPNLIAHQDHGDSQRHQRDRQEVLHLAVAQRFHAGVVGWAFHATVPAPIVIGPLPVCLAVGLVVLLVVGDEVVEGEAVVTRHEVDTLFRLPFFVTVDLGAADQPVGRPAQRPGYGAEEVAYIIPEGAVPLLPGIADEA